MSPSAYRLVQIAYRALRFLVSDLRRWLDDNKPLALPGATAQQHRPPLNGPPPDHTPTPRA